MALQQHHLLSDVTVRGFVAGATNILFRQQKYLSDAIVEVRIFAFELLELRRRVQGGSRDRILNTALKFHIDAQIFNYFPMR